MNNIEQEYSFKVRSINPFLKYCKDNGFKKLEKTEQIRTLYKKSDKTMLRLTIKKCGRKVIKEMDFKQDKLSDDPFIERKGSLPISYTDDEAVYSIIDFLGYKKDVELIRTRYVYEKKDVKVEIDDYISPNKMLVVSIEGNANGSKKLYYELTEKYNQYLFKEE